MRTLNQHVVGVIERAWAGDTAEFGLSNLHIDRTNQTARAIEMNKDGVFETVHFGEPSNVKGVTHVVTIGYTTIFDIVQALKSKPKSRGNRARVARI